jgi:hypothetical protein
MPTTDGKSVFVDTNVLVYANKCDFKSFQEINIQSI